MESNHPPKSLPDRLFQQSPKYWNRNLNVQNVLVELESCVGMFCCSALSAKRLQGTLPCHYRYTYSDWLKNMPATLEPHVLMYCIPAGKISTCTPVLVPGTSFILSSIVMKPRLCTTGTVEPGWKVRWLRCLRAFSFHPAWRALQVQPTIGVGLLPIHVRF